MGYIYNTITHNNQRVQNVIKHNSSISLRSSTWRYIFKPESKIMEYRVKATFKKPLFLTLIINNLLRNTKITCYNSFMWR